LLNDDPPAGRILAAEPPPLDQLTLPYRFYSDEDIAHRLIYVEASRGCPFRCEFCLSALEKKVVRLFSGSVPRREPGEIRCCTATNFCCNAKTIHQDCGPQDSDSLW